MGQDTVGKVSIFLSSLFGPKVAPLKGSSQTGTGKETCEKKPHSNFIVPFMSEFHSELFHLMKEV